MKIGVIDNLHIGGAKRVLFEQVKRLSENNTLYWITNRDVDVFGIAGYCEEVKKLNFDILNRHGIGRIYNDWLLLGWSNYYKKALNVFKLWDVDVILAHPDQVTQTPLIFNQTSIPTIYYAEEWLRSVYEPALHQVTGGNVITRYHERLRRSYLRNVDRNQVKQASTVLVNSKFEQANFRKGYGVEAKVVYPGVDTDVFLPSNEPTRNYFLFVGSKSDIEGYDLIKKLVEIHEVEIKHIDFTGRNFQLSEADLISEYSRAAAVLCLSQMEPFGLIAIEAMSCGVPVIARNEGGYKETIVEGDTGFLVNGTVDKVFSKMNLLLNDSNMRRSMGKQARNHVKKHFSWGEHGNKLESVIEDLVYEN